MTKNWAIGPFNPVTVSDHTNSSTEWIKLFNWLDKKELNSMVYESFGTTVTFTDEEMKEITNGLEEIGQKLLSMGFCFSRKAHKKIKAYLLYSFGDDKEEEDRGWLQPSFPAMGSSENLPEVQGRKWGREKCGELV
ncbi:hypothetical protein L1987_24648 [Smallanthus sonchifolius]|uniref:Uncharacterized protein n=1 Tax=Smallanthus sonchifolius TaxID=185202 RepID=A0ACB9IMH1_9ASTR|nr:hypothetical protein L1987_24648 [Smallanthus sonchifolius]